VLAVQIKLWDDRFAEPLLAENKDFIERSVKWSAFDVYRNLLISSRSCQVAEEVLTTRPPDKKVADAAIKAANCLVQVEFEADEVSVDVAWLRPRSWPSRLWRSPGRLEVLAHWPGEPSRVRAAVDVVPVGSRCPPGCGERPRARTSM